MELRKEILDTLEQDARISPKELAIRLGADEVDVVNEVAAMEQEGIICGYLTLIDWDKTSVDKVTALIEVKVTPTKGLGFDSIAKRIEQFPQVSSIYLMSGGFDFTVIIEGRSMRLVAEFVRNNLSTIEGVLSTATHFVLRRYKDHGVTFDEKKLDERVNILP